MIARSPTSSCDPGTIRHLEALGVSGGWRCLEAKRASNDASRACALSQPLSKLYFEVIAAQLSGDAGS